MKRKKIRLKWTHVFLFTLIIAVSPVLSGQVETVEPDHDISGKAYSDTASIPYIPAEDPSPLPLMPDGQVRNVILMIGDGMGLAYANGTRYKRVGPDGRLHFERMPVTGLMSCHSANRLITDSAASGTAMASGRKTNNGMVGVTPDSTVAPTILEVARDRGMATGLVVTSSITHATPAVFAAHVPSRGNQREIARQLAESGINVLLGGGRGYFLPGSVQGSLRADDENLISLLEERSYAVVSNREALLSADTEYLAGFFQLEALTTRAPEPTLAEMTEKSLEILDLDDDGFFLMVEGSQIDWAGHRNDADYAYRETLLFDDAVRVALEYAVRDSSTLVIVTADHETGGMTLVKGPQGDFDFQTAWSTGSHSAVSVPVYAFGPGAICFTGVLDNTWIPRITGKLLGFDRFVEMLESRVNH